MPEIIKLPEWLPLEVYQAAKAKCPGKLIPLKTDAGGVLLKVPSREDILARYPAPGGKDTEARGMFTSSDGDLDKDLALAFACVVYPDEATMHQRLATNPMAGVFLATRVKAAAIGAKGELKGAPQDLDGAATLEATGVKVFTILTDLKVPHDRLVVRTPGPDALRQYEALGKTRSPIVAKEGLVLACLLHPTQVLANEIFQSRPLVGSYLADRLLKWSLGEMEEAEGEF